MSTAYLNASDEVLAIAAAAVAPTLAAYQVRVTEATQVILGAPDELVGKLSLGRGGVWTYHQRTSGDGTSIGHYASVEDVADLVAQRKADVDTTTAALLNQCAVAVVDFHRGGAVTKEVTNDGRDLKTSLDGAATKVAVDAIVDARVVGDYSSDDAAALQTLYDTLDLVTEHDYGDQDGAFAIALSNGLEQKFTLTGSLGAGDISITVPTGPRKVVIEIAQDGTGGHMIPASAWDGGAVVNWGSKGAPTFGDVASGVRSVLLDYRSNGSLRGYYDTNVF